MKLAATTSVVRWWCDWRKRVLLDQKRVLNYVLDRIREAEAEAAKVKNAKDAAKRKGNSNGKANDAASKKKQRR